MNFFSVSSTLIISRESTTANDHADTRRGEILLGFYLRAGVWIDGIEILTSLGRRSGVYGKVDGGSGFVPYPADTANYPWADFSVLVIL